MTSSNNGFAKLRFFNTLGGKYQDFVPLEKKRVALYSCGPTVYDFAHVGNFRYFLFVDFLVRLLRYQGYEVTKVQNITDVGHLTQDDLADAGGKDKIVAKAQKEGVTPMEIARFYEQAFIEDENKLQILPPDHRLRATDFIPEQIKLTEKLIAKNMAYEVKGSVYFRTKNFARYGCLSGNRTADLKVGARIDPNPDKEDPRDFALWKSAAPEHLLQWPSPWGQGYPGWHLECSAMSRAIFGERFDIHTGGEDNIFPHHECEIAQNEASMDDTQTIGAGGVSYWLHSKHLLVDGQKMSKSLGNVYTVKQLEDQGWQANEIRYALISGHYRSSINLSQKSLSDARAAIARIQETINMCQHYLQDTSQSATNPLLATMRQEFLTACNNDLNTATALGVVFGWIKKIWQQQEDKKLDPAMARAVHDFLSDDLSKVMAILPPAKKDSKDHDHIQSLIAERDLARKEKNWTKADQIRTELRDKFGVTISDQDDGARWQQR